jgi:SAM-dependent methyltransferase
MAYARRLCRRAGQNLRLVFGALGAHYVRVKPYEDFGGVPSGGSCERYVLGEQPAGFVRVNLAAYHLATRDIAGKVVVDAGTNEGAGAALFARHAARVVAFDRSEEGIAAARERYPLPVIEFHVHDATRPFPIADGSADVVFSSEVIEHLADGQAFLLAARRALRPGGLLLLKTPNDDFNRYENRLNPHHINSYDAKRLRSEVEKSFEAVEISGLTYDLTLLRSLEERPDSLPPEVLPYRFGDPIVVDRGLLLRLQVTPRHAPLAGPEPPEYLWVRATAPSLRPGQEAPPSGR